MSFNNQFKRGYEHGEPGGANGAPIPLRFHSEPTHYSNTHPLRNDPDANPFIPPYTGNPGDPLYYRNPLPWQTEDNVDA